VDYHKLNVQTKKDPFPLPFLDSVLNSIVGHEMYSFMEVTVVITKLKWRKKTNKGHSF